MNSYILYKLNTQKAILNTQQTCSGIKTLPGKKETDCCVCSNCKKLEIWCKCTRMICVKCDKGLHGTCLSKHKCK